MKVAIDIGASSGRLVLGSLHNNKLQMEEIHRFPNGFIEREGQAIWDVDELLHQILLGLEKVKKLGYEEISIGIDTWAVDYVLIADNGKRMKESHSYRDRRTTRAMEDIEQHISLEEIYLRTGIQMQSFNTLFQLYVEDKEILKKAKYILLIPDYLAYRLTGNAVMEITNASTMQLLNPINKNLDEYLLGILGIKSSQFAPPVQPGHIIGTLQKIQFPQYDLPNTNVIAVASHDTASAVVGTPSEEEKWAYLSSGTWSLIGVEQQSAILTLSAYEGNYTNEWGVCGTFRFLKNIMGMWIIQEIMKSEKIITTWEQVLAEAACVDPYQQFIDFNEDRFLNPANMIAEIQQYCRETKQTVPETIGELAACVFSNLSIIYAITIKQLKEITQEDIDILHIVGGGSQNNLLNQMTSNMIQIPILAGPTEATAIGNLLVQFIATQQIDSIQEGRTVVTNSFPLQKISPQKLDAKSIMEQFTDITRKGRGFK